MTHRTTEPTYARERIARSIEQTDSDRSAVRWRLQAPRDDHDRGKPNSPDASPANAPREA